MAATVARTGPSVRAALLQPEERHSYVRPASQDSAEAAKARATMHAKLLEDREPPVREAACIAFEQMHRHQVRPPPAGAPGPGGAPETEGGTATATATAAARARLAGVHTCASECIPHVPN